MRRVFFSFDYTQDAWRAAQVRNSWVTRKGVARGFVDAAKWEKVRLGGDRAIKNWIDDQLKGTSVTVILIGKRTSTRKYVLHEIERSHQLRKGLLGIYIHGIRDQSGQYSLFRGSNPFKEIPLTPRNGIERLLPGTLARVCSTYFWESDNGRVNLPQWIEQAARKGSR